jgi:hypothetical protein
MGKGIFDGCTFSELIPQVMSVRKSVDVYFKPLSKVLVSEIDFRRKASSLKNHKQDEALSFSVLELFFSLILATFVAFRDL